MAVVKEPNTSKASRSRCPLNASLEVLGDRWSLLVVRDLMLNGAHTYKQLLGGGEEISTNILADRLERLVSEGLVTKSRLVSDGRRFVYLLTDKGIDLVPVVMELILWGARYADTDAPPDALREMEKDREQFVKSTRQKWEEDCARMQPEISAELAPVRAAKI